MPGLGFPQHPAHRIDDVGLTATVWSYDADEIAGKKKFRGPVVAVSDRSLRIAEGEKELDIPYETIVRGNLIDEG